MSWIITETMSKVVLFPKMHPLELLASQLLTQLSTVDFEKKDDIFVLTHLIPMQPVSYYNHLLWGKVTNACEWQLSTIPASLFLPFSSTLWIIGKNWSESVRSFSKI